MRWIARERSKIDQTACPRPIARFINMESEFFYVPASQVMAIAASAIQGSGGSRMESYVSRALRSRRQASVSRFGCPPAKSNIGLTAWP